MQIEENEIIEINKYLDAIYRDRFESDKIDCHYHKIKAILDKIKEKEKQIPEAEMEKQKQRIKLLDEIDCDKQSERFQRILDKCSEFEAKYNL